MFFNGFGQTKSRHIWVTYGHDKFVMSPGTETSLFFHKNVGIQLGIASYIQLFDELKMANKIFLKDFGVYNFNIGPSAEFKIRDKHSLGGTIGAKIYYGPNYKFLQFYEEGGYNIYFDAANRQRPDLGIDIGLFYAYNKFSSILKYDSARNNWRFGFGVKLVKKIKEKSKNSKRNKLLEVE